MYYTIGRNILRLPWIVKTMQWKIHHPDRYSQEDCYNYVRKLVRLMQWSGHIRTKGYGMENLPKEGGYMLCPNHQGKYDAYGIVSVHPEACTVVMDEAKSHTVFVREIIDMLKGKRMDVHDPRKALTVIQQITQEVSEGRRYILFPEGGYAKDQKNHLGEFKPGCFKIPLRSGTPIVPVVLVDSYKAFNSWQMRPVRTQVHFLEPICYEEYRNMKTVEIADLVKARIQQKLDELAA